MDRAPSIVRLLRKTKIYIFRLLAENLFYSCLHFFPRFFVKYYSREKNLEELVAQRKSPPREECLYQIHLPSILCHLCRLIITADQEIVMGWHHLEVSGDSQAV